MRFLVAYDNTEGAKGALAAAATLARAAGAEVVVLQVLNPLIDAARVNAPTTHEAMALVTADARTAIEAALSALSLVAEVRVETGTRGEDDWEHIVHVAQDIDATLIAIGSQRVGGVAGAILGSVTRAVVQHAHCPVLVVRPDHR